MARYTLIDGYLDTMRSEIRWRRDLDDLVCEMEDHLYSAVEFMVSRGVEPDAAQRTTLTRFGEPNVLAAVYASTDTGGLAVPTTFTIRAGTFALVSAGFWLAAAAIVAFGGMFTDDWQAAYLVFSVAVLVAGVLGLLTVIGVSSRLGGLGLVGMIGIVVTGVGIFVSLAAWALSLWMGLQGIGLLVFGLAALRTGIVPKWSTLFTSSGFLIGAIIWMVATAAKIGEPDAYGDYEAAWDIGAVVGMAIVAIGLIGWGVWLRNEESVDMDSDTDYIAA
jgi:hypothetical protein